MTAGSSATRKVDALVKRLQNRRTAPIPPNPAPPKINASRLVEQINALLRDLELAASAGAVLPAKDVLRASTLVRLYADANGNADAWLHRERARQAAKILKTDRLIGSRALQRPKFRLSELREEPQEESDPAITLFDLVKEFGALLERAKQGNASDPQEQDSEEAETVDSSRLRTSQQSP